MTDSLLSQLSGLKRFAQDQNSGSVMCLISGIHFRSAYCQMLFDQPEGTITDIYVHVPDPKNFRNVKVEILDTIYELFPYGAIAIDARFQKTIPGSWEDEDICRGFRHSQTHDLWLKVRF